MAAAFSRIPIKRTIPSIYFGINTNFSTDPKRRVTLVLEYHLGFFFFSITGFGILYQVGQSWRNRAFAAPPGRGSLVLLQWLGLVNLYHQPKPGNVHCVIFPGLGRAVPEEGRCQPGAGRPITGWWPWHGWRWRCWWCPGGQWWKRWLVQKLPRKCLFRLPWATCAWLPRDGKPVFPGLRRWVASALLS